MNRARTAGEWALRVLAIALVAWSLWRSLGAADGRPAERATSASLAHALVRWSTVAAPRRVHVALERAPDVRDRDWLRAVAGAGARVEWSGERLVPIASSAEPRADPARGADVSVAAPSGATVSFGDTLGALADVQADGGIARLYLPRPRASVDAAVGGVVARAAQGDSLSLGALLVLGAAGWETKFTVAALEERGWKVDARIPVSPLSAATQGEIATIDTARYAAVLAIDSTAAAYADRIAAYVRSGGGLVLWNDAVRTGTLRALAAGTPGPPIDDANVSPPDSAPRSVLELSPIASLAPDAVALERRGRDVAVAARRIGPGRVVQTGYGDSWRWRMAGGDEAPAAHREWIATLVARVAHAGRIARVLPPTDPAPLASLVDRLGPATPVDDVAASIDPATFARWAFALIAAALLIEWVSRRVRGVK